MEVKNIKVRTCKPGHKTTEFWLAVAATFAGAFATAFSSEPWARALGAISSGLASMGYSFSRAKVKA